jgi:hypothetical protein
MGVNAPWAADCGLNRNPAVLARASRATLPALPTAPLRLARSDRDSIPRSLRHPCVEARTSYRFVSAGGRL